MNRKELLSAIATKTGLSQSDADKVLDAFQDVVFDVVAKQHPSLEHYEELASSHGRNVPLVLLTPRQPLP